MSGEIKQVIVLRSDLGMGKGKLVAQGSHAALMSYFAAERKDRDTAASWVDMGEKKVVLKVDSEEALLELHKIVKGKHIPCALVVDAGLTQIPSGSPTALGIGPWSGDEIDSVTSKLKLL
jgi:PTH2 family peptidyl-tRNA hydrolase